MPQDSTLNGFWWKHFLSPDSVHFYDYNVYITVRAAAD